MLLFFFCVANKLLKDIRSAIPCNSTSNIPSYYTQQDAEPKLLFLY
jgi:hypothetical protein